MVGYNKSKIPKDWNVKKIKEIAEVVSGGTPLVDMPEYWNGDISWITPSEIVKIDGKYIKEETEKKISKLGLQNSSAVLIPPGSLILCSRATIGDCAISTYPIATNQGFKNLIPKRELLSVEFLYYKIILNKKQLLRISQGSTFLEFSKKDIENFKILLPPLQEQKRIVAVLEVWDKYLELLKRKIEIKKNIKKGLMQRMFPKKDENVPELRFKEFSGPWKEKKLGEVFELKKGSGLSKEKLSINGKYKCILYGEIYTIYNEYIKNIKSKTDVEEGVKSKKGDILIPASTTTSHLDLATSTTVLEDGVLLGGDINILRAKQEINSIFMSLYLTHAKKFDLAKLAQGTTIIHLYGNHFKNLKIKFPPLPEQEKIAEVLTTTDKEIEALERKYKLIEEQRKYLLEKLVNGEIRVPEDLVINN